ncbi:MAG: O-antigen ligase family protein [Gammaproteobacteria bacterium]
MLEQIRNRFIQYGWLTPALLPLTMLGGRGLFNSVFHLYILWALLSARTLRIADQRVYLTLQMLLLGGYALGIPFALDPALAVKRWGSFVLYVASALITLAMIQQDRDNLRRLLALFGVAGLFALGFAYLDLIWLLLTTEAFVPRLQMAPVHLIIYTPFTLAWLWSRTPPGYRRATGVLTFLALVAGYTVFSEERASFIGLLCAIAGFFVLIVQTRPRRALVLVVAATLVALALNGQGLLRGLSSEGDLFSRLDEFSSYRLSLWTQALEHPPEHPLIGVGMGNVQHYDAVVLIIGNKVRHLHNLWLDAWYDTGLIGLTLLIALIGYGLVSIARAWKTLPATARYPAGILLAAALTLLAQAQFSISYASREIGIYFFICLALLSHLAQQARQPGPT